MEDFSLFSNHNAIPESAKQIAVLNFIEMQSGRILFNEGISNSHPAITSVPIIPKISAEILEINFKRS